MDEGERCRVKCLAGESAGSFVVEGIAEQRMADVSHVDADLVGAAGFEVEFEVGENGAVREGAVMGYGALAGGKVDGALDEGAVAVSYTHLDVYKRQTRRVPSVC